LLQTSRHLLCFFIHIYLSRHGCYETKPLPIYEHIRYDEETSQTTTGVGLLGQQAHSLSSGNTNCHNSITNTMNKHRLYYRPASQILVGICIMKSTTCLFMFNFVARVLYILLNTLFLKMRKHNNAFYWREAWLFTNTFRCP